MTFRVKKNSKITAFKEGFLKIQDFFFKLQFFKLKLDLLKFTFFDKIFGVHKKGGTKY